MPVRNIIIQSDSTISIYEQPLQDFQPIVVVTPPAPPVGKYIMLNAIRWNATGLNTLPIDDTSEVTYFVLPVAANGTLLNMSSTLETKFVADVHTKGKKATFSVAGGAQNVADITSAVVNNRTAFINNIASHITLHNYDGVTIDIENTALNPQVITDFFIALRIKLNTIRPNLIIGAYTQPYQLNTVWANIAQAASGIDWLSPMIYDFVYTIPELVTLTKAWLPRVGNDKTKLLCGIAVNYPTGLTTAQFGQVLDIVTVEGWKGVGVWENTLYTQPWLDVRHSKWPIIA